MPDSFPAACPVPGLVDMKSGDTDSGDWYWYKRTFTVEEPKPQSILLKIHKAKYGQMVWLNGNLVGEHLPCFTPAYLDVTDHLNYDGGNNTIVVRVGKRDQLPETVFSGNDFEKTRYIPGIYDSVELILSGSPRIVHIQTNPELENRVDVKLLVNNETSVYHRGQITCEVRRVDNGALVGSKTVDLTLTGGESREVWLNDIAITDCIYWTPENPFLYELTTRTAGDERKDRFGMRTFRFHPETMWPELNGQTYMMRGTNICIYRFFEDPQRGDLPWDMVWVRNLIRKFKSMHWNSVRFCIGFPPDFWYDICDEEGLMIQDEYPLWHGYNNDDPPSTSETLPSAYTVEQLTSEATDWIYERCNHPSVFLWDISNETESLKTTIAVENLRSIDIQGRRWEQGTGNYNVPADGDPFEIHKYLFFDPEAKLSKFHNQDVKHIQNRMYPDHPRILNEYGWLWICRDGTPTRLTHDNYEFLVGGGIGSGDWGTETDRRYTYATHLAASTEYWRCRRDVQILHHFCGLGYSRSDPDNIDVYRKNGETSDNFLEPLSELEYDPYFYSYVRDSFAPIGVCIDRYHDNYPAGSTQEIPVSILNDTSASWTGDVMLKIVAGGAVTEKESAAVISSQTKSFTVPSIGKATQSFTVTIPARGGDYTLVAEYHDGTEPIHSIRDFEISKSNGAKTGG